MFRINFERSYSKDYEADWYGPFQPDFTLNTALAARYWKLASRGLDLDFDLEIPTGRVLEIGGGCSSHGHMLLENGAKSVVTVDLFAQRLMAVPIHDGLIKVAADAVSLPFDRAAAFDMVFSSLTMAHLTSLVPRVAREVHGVLRPGGIFCGLEINYYSPISIARYFTRRHSKNSFVFYPHTLHGWLAAAGFQDIRMVPLNIRAPWLPAKSLISWLLGTCIFFSARANSAIPAKAGDHDQPYRAP